MANEFGILLRDLRERANLTQEQLEEKSRVAIRTIRRLEAGEHSPRKQTAELLADALARELDVRSDKLRLLMLGGPPGVLDLTPRERWILSISADNESQSSIDGSSDTELPYEKAARQHANEAADVLAPLRGGLADAADQLAEEVKRRWVREAEHRLAHGPFLLPVRWQPAPERLAGRGQNASTPSILIGELAEIADKYQQIKSEPKRLVLLGDAGSGKTVLSLHFTLDYVQNKRSHGGPVPVVFNVGSWNPKKTGLRDWLIERLLHDFPGLLAQGPGGSTTAAELVEAGGILPVLDGFDEIAVGLYGEALDRLDSTSLPMVLTSRTAQYAEAVEKAGVLTGAAVVEINALSSVELDDHLRRTSRGAPWNTVMDLLRDQPDRPGCRSLADTLATPLMLNLARTIYSARSGPDPAELLDANTFPTRAALEAHLLSRFVPTVYRDRDPQDAERWLGYLARHLDQPGGNIGRDLEWWRLGDSLPRSSRFVAVVSACALTAAVVDLPISMVVALASGNSAAMALEVGALNGLLNGPVIGLAFGLVYLLSVVSGRMAIQPSHMRLRLGRRLPSGRAAPVGKRFAFGLLGGFVIGLGYGPTLVFEQELFLGWPNRIAFVINAAVTDAVVTGVVFGLAAGLAFALMAALEAPLDLRSAATPLDSLATNRTTAIRQVLVGAPLFGLIITVGGRLIIGLFQRLGNFSWPWPTAILDGAVGGLAGALAFVFAFTAWGQWIVLSRLWLPLTGKLPWAMTAFLEDAYENGVLRQAGTVYQFRHARLQDHLSKTSRMQHTDDPNYGSTGAV